MSELQRGANIAITKENPDLKLLTVGVEWKAVEAALEDDLQLGVMLCDSNDKLLSTEDLVFFNQLQDSSNSVTMGEDKQQADIDLSSVPPQVEKIDFVLWINSLDRTLKNLSRLTVRALNTETGSQLVKTENFVEELEKEKAVCLVQVYRYKGDWKLKAKGDGWSDGLNGMLKAYGVK